MQLVVAKANYALPSYEAMYKLLANNYIDSYINSQDADSIITTYKAGSDKSLLKVSMLGHYIKSKINLVMTDDEVKLMRFFPNTKFIYSFLQISDNKWLGRMMTFIYLSVKTNIKISIKKGCLDQYLEPTHNYGFKWKTLSQGFNLDKLQLKDFVHQDFTGVHNDAEFKIRLISDVDIPLKNILQETHFMNKNTKPKLRKIIVHIHGGGFICMSSSSHQSYLRKYVREADATVFSIDYPLSPMSKYKQTIDAVFKAYVYILVSLIVYLGKDVRFTRL